MCVERAWLLLFFSCFRAAKWAIESDENAKNKRAHDQPNHFIKMFPKAHCFTHAARGRVGDAKPTRTKKCANIDETTEIRQMYGTRKTIHNIDSRSDATAEANEH